MKLEKFRQPYLVILLSILMLFTQCDKYEIDSYNKINFNKSFNYSIFEYYKNNGLRISINDFKNKENLEDKSQKVLDKINNFYNTKFDLQQIDIQLLNSNNLRTIEDSFDNENYLNEIDIYLLNFFIEDIESYGPDYALLRFEERVVNLEIDNVEFEKYNNYANVVKTLDLLNPDLFTPSIDENNYERLNPCAKAVAIYTLSTLGLAACGTGILCVAAIITKIDAFNSMLGACAGKQLY